LHAAKGLEFVHVFIIGCEEECLPHKNSIALDTIEEERRLAYVGMTRAQKTLSLLYAKQRKRFNELQPMTPSRFLSELPDDLVERIGTGEDVPPEIQRASGQAHLANLKALLKES
jgi:ATP-dependent DNA helicase Rep